MGIRSWYREKYGIPATFLCRITGGSPVSARTRVPMDLAEATVQAGQGSIETAGLFVNWRGQGDAGWCLEMPNNWQDAIFPSYFVSALRNLVRGPLGDWLANLPARVGEAFLADSSMQDAGTAHGGGVWLLVPRCLFAEIKMLVPLRPITGFKVVCHDPAVVAEAEARRERHREEQAAEQVERTERAAFMSDLDAYLRALRYEIEQNRLMCAPAPDLMVAIENPGAALPAVTRYMASYLRAAGRSGALSQSSLLLSLRTALDAATRDDDEEEQAEGGEEQHGG